MVAKKKKKAAKAIWTCEKKFQSIKSREILGKVYEISWNLDFSFLWWNRNKMKHQKRTVVATRMS